MLLIAKGQLQSPCPTFGKLNSVPFANVTLAIAPPIFGEKPMAKLSAACSVCAKPLALASEARVCEGWYRTYKCGHAFFETPSANDDGNFANINYQSCTKSKAAFDFQKDGVRFMMDALSQSGGVLCADPMGLGKTIQAALVARESTLPDGTPKYKSILTVVKSATTYQWFAESKEWFDAGLWSVFMIQGTKGFIPPGFRMYILSMDTFSRFMKTPALAQVLKSFCIDLVIVDECHSFKNPDSARSQALVAFLQDISQTEISRDFILSCIMCGERWSETVKIKINCRNKQSGIQYRHATTCPKCKSRVVQYQDQMIVLDDKERTKGLILLSGTPIKNRAEEYFIPLNLMRPDIFTSLLSFRRQWLTQDENGKWNRIAPWRLEAFREVTADFIIRREKNEVLSLPAFRRTFDKIGIEGEEFKTAYNAALDALQERVDALAAEGKEMSFFEVEANLMSLRRIVGLAKVPAAIEYVEEFLESTENEKIAIGIHHISVRDNLYFALKQKGIRVIKLSGEDSAERKDQILKEFARDPELRVIIINMIAGGVGLNIQVANNILTIERQWNAADEEQFEGRFHRQGQLLSVHNSYMIAEGIPIEDKFSAMVEDKRKLCAEALDRWDFCQDKGAVRDIVMSSLSTRIK